LLASTGKPEVPNSGHVNGR